MVFFKHTTWRPCKGRRSTSSNKDSIEIWTRSFWWTARTCKVVDSEEVFFQGTLVRVKSTTRPKLPQIYSVSTQGEGCSFMCGLLGLLTWIHVWLYKSYGSEFLSLQFYCPLYIPSPFIEPTLHVIILRWVVVLNGDWNPLTSLKILLSLTSSSFSK